MCRGGESQAEAVERQFEARGQPDNGQLENGEQTTPPAHCFAMPARALRSRVSAHSARPTWAAWLPQDLQPQAETTPDLRSLWAVDPGLQQNIEVCEDSLVVMSSDVGYATEQQVVYLFQPVAWVPMEDVMPLEIDQTQAVAFENFDNWSDANSSGMYYADPQMSGCYGQFDQSACQGNLSIGPLPGKAWQLSRESKDGSRQVQDAFENASCDQEREALASELVGHVWEALKCMHANHVVQKCITTIRPQAAQFVIDELSHHGPKGILQAARHRFGCRILQRLLEHCTEEQMYQIIEVLLNDAVELSSHAYGHYVMQHIFEQCGSDVVSRLASILQQSLTNMDADGFVGSVIGKAFTHINNEACVSLASSLLQEHARVLVMACSRWGYLAVKTALQLVADAEQEKACSELASCSTKLRATRYGRLVATFVTELRGGKASAQW